MRSIRLDDFPHGDLTGYKTFGHQGCLDRLSEVLSILEEEEMNYFLGATPFLMKAGDVTFLNKHVRHGRVCMHGFLHGWNHPNWDQVVLTWRAGGEFAGLSASQIDTLYDGGLAILERVDAFSPDDFVPPFNVYTQELLDVLNEKQIKRIHGCDKQFNDFNLARLDYHDIELVLSKQDVTYDFVNRVINHLDDSSQITLHWGYDIVLVKDWQKHYRELCHRIKDV